MVAERADVGKWRGRASPAEQLTEAAGCHWPQFGCYSGHVNRACIAWSALPGRPIAPHGHDAAGIQGHSISVRRPLTPRLGPPSHGQRPRRESELFFGGLMQRVHDVQRCRSPFLDSLVWPPVQTIEFLQSQLMVERLQNSHIRLITSLRLR